jgi:uncharacterized protein (DUF1499 family)
MEPIPLEGTPENALARFKQILSSRARTEVVEEEGWYLRAEETSALLRFVDDVEIEIDPRAAEIHFRSASRTGWSDLGVNRRRMKAIRAAYLGEGS